MNWFFTLLAAAFTLVIGLVTWSPWYTPFSELKREGAVVQEVEAVTYRATFTRFRTSSGLTVRCSGDNINGCKPALMRSLRDARTPVDVWHNGKQVYQLAAAGQVIVPYKHVYEGRELFFSLFVVLLMAWCVRGAMYFGLFSNYPRGS